MIDIRQLLVASSLVLLTSSYYGSDEGDVIVYPEDPESKEGIRPLPSDAGAYATTTAGAESLGVLLAGRTEFPYLVDVRLGTRSQEDWVLGCLLSHKNVLVTCRWANFYLKTTRERNIDWERKSFTKSRWRPPNPELIIYYAPLYINERKNEYTLFWDYVSLRERQGKRSVKFLSSHPLCDKDPINYDFAVLTLAREIPPIVPYIGYMPIRIERDRLLITDFDLSHHENKRIICNIASFGRGYANWKQHVTQDYKVKYRVYIEDWASCTSHFDKYRCPQSEEDPPVPPGANYTPHHCPSPLVALNMDKEKFGKGFENLMCFNSRARVGAVCDHDNGAPLVCDGKVFGIVTRGAHLRFCNDLLPVPFIVVKITPAADYYMNLARNPYSFEFVQYDDLRFEIPTQKKRSSADVVKTCKFFFFFIIATIFLYTSAFD